jgi:GT2 family glycosyltransferase
VSTRPEVSVIVPTYRDGAALAACLAALDHQTYPRERYEVLVVDNAPTPPRDAPGAAGVRWLHEPTPGSYAARNRALDEARGALLAFTDADCVPAPDWVAAAVAAFANEPATARLAGHVELTVRGRVGAAALHERAFGFRQDRLARRGTAVTANMWARREVFDAVGPFDPALRSGGDVAWGWAAQAAGFPIRYAPEVRVTHPSRERVRDLTEKARRVYGGEFARRHAGPAPRAVLLLRGLALLKPPVRRLRDALGDGRLRGLEPLAVAYVEMRLRGAQFAEHVRLSLGGAPRR